MPGDSNQSAECKILKGMGGGEGDVGLGDGGRRQENRSHHSVQGGAGRYRARQGGAGGGPPAGLHRQLQTPLPLHAQLGTTDRHRASSNST